MKEIKQFICLVDSHRKNGLVFCPSPNMLAQRPTKGRYQVAAKTEKEAEQLLRKAIGFGSIRVYYEDKAPQQTLPYKEVRKLVGRQDKDKGHVVYDYIEARHATACREGEQQHA